MRKPEDKAKEVQGARERLGTREGREEREERETLTMAEAIARLKTTRATFYRWLRAGRIKGMKVGRQWRFYARDVERFLEGKGPRVDPPAGLGPLLGVLEAQVAERQGGVEPEAEDGDDAARAVRLMVRLAWVARASHLHLEPTPEGGRLRLRIDGVLHEVATVDNRLMPVLVHAWKALTSCDVTVKGLPQDGRAVCRLLAREAEDEVDLRACFMPGMEGEGVTVRLLDRATEPLRLDRLPYSDAVRDAFRRALSAMQGLVVVTGPVGSGKTTTVYACLAEIITPERKVMTLEDPVSLSLPGAVQAQVRPQHGLTMPHLLRPMLRSDADAIMVDAVRDRETLVVMLQAALEGRLVLTCLHAGEAVAALQRLVAVAQDPYHVAATVRLIVAQCLPRQVCRHCTEPDTPSAETLEELARRARAGGVDLASLSPRWVRGRGCPTCGGVGYRGRIVIAEALEVGREMAQALVRGDSAETLQRLAVAKGMVSLAADGLRRAAAGETTPEEVLRVLRAQV
jgi:excisionase family DNA binding protein